MIARAREMDALLAATYPDARAELDFTNAFELLVATVLSAQSTDKRVNATTPALFARYPDAATMADGDRAEIEELIHPVGFFRAKTDSLLRLAAKLVEDFGGEVPASLDELVTLPGVGRKTANVVLNSAFRLPTMPVDTHIFRVANRLGLAHGDTPRAIEDRLLEVIPAEYLLNAHHWLLLHGRYVCKARKPECQRCPLVDLCAFKDKTLPLAATLPLARPRKPSPAARSRR